MTFVTGLDNLGNVSACLARIAVRSDMSPSDVRKALTVIIRTGSSQLVRSLACDLPRRNIRKLLIATGAAEVTANNSLLIKNRPLRMLRSAVRSLWDKG